MGGVQRLAGKGGDPVVQLQTNFGGGKTHSMLALYHLFSGLSQATWPVSTQCWQKPKSRASRRLTASCWWVTRFLRAIQ